MKNFSLKCKNLILLIVSFSLFVVFCFAKNPDNRAIAQDYSVNCEYDHTKTKAFDSSGLIAKSADGEIVISPCDGVDFKPPVSDGCSFLTHPQEGDGFFTISLSDSVVSATFSITASMRLSTQNLSIDVLKNGESVLSDGAISLAETHVFTGSVGNFVYDYKPKTFGISVSGGGEYLVKVIANSGAISTCYVSNIMVKAVVKEKTEFIPEYTVTESGVLPETAPEYKVDATVYTFLGWVNDKFEIVNSNNSLPAGKYYAVYAYIEELGGSIKKTFPTGIKLGYNVHFYNSVYRDALIENGGIKVFADFSIDDYNTSVKKELDKYTIKDNALNYEILIDSVPENYYKTSVSSKLIISFGSSENALSTSTPLKRNVYDVAYNLYNDLKEIEVESLGYIYPVYDDSGYIKYSRFTDTERTFFKKIIDVAG